MKRLPLARVRSALVVAPHPDDEAIGAWGVIRTLRRRGARVRVVVVADGAASHPNSVAWPKRRLVAERRRETRRVMRAIGIGAGDIAFLALRDGAVTAADPRPIARAVAAARADLILLPSLDDDHADHRAVAAAAVRARTPGARRFAYLVWPDGRARVRGAMLGFPLGDASACKRAAITCYATQMGAIRDDPTGFSITPDQHRRFARPVEQFRALAR